MAKRAKYGSIKPLYSKLEITSSHFADILSCRINAKYSIAKVIAKETNTDIDIWVYGGTGTPESRRAAVQAWAASAQQ